MSTNIQLRVDPSLGDRLKRQAAREKISTNKLVINAINMYLESDKEREWREGFEAMGRDPEANDVDYMLDAARAVLLAE